MSAPEGSLGGAGSQFPFVVNGTRQIGVGTICVLTFVTTKVSPLLHLLIPGPPSGRQSASLEHALPLVPSAGGAAASAPPSSDGVTTIASRCRIDPASSCPGELLLLLHATTT